MIGIYKITNPKGKVYVGQSMNIGQREASYKGLHCSNQTRLFNSITKYGFSNHTFEVIEECTVHQLNIRERYWQDYYNVLEVGLNCRLTGLVDKSGLVSVETRERMSRAATGKVLSKETKDKMSANMLGNKRAIGNSNTLGRTHTEEAKAKMSKAKKGIKRGPRSQEVTQKISKGNLGKVVSEESKQRMSEAAKRRWKK